MRHYERKQKWCEFTVLDPLGLLWVMFRKVFFRITWEHKSKKKNPFFYGDDEKNNSNMKLLTLNDIKTMCEHAMKHKSGQSYKNNLFCPEVILLFQRWYNKKNPAGSAIKTQKKSGSFTPQLTPARVCASCGSWAELFDKKLLRWKDDVANCEIHFYTFWHVYWRYCILSSHCHVTARTVKRLSSGKCTRLWRQVDTVCKLCNYNVSWQTQ